MSYYTHEETICFQPNQVRLEGLGFVKCYHNINCDSNIKFQDPIVIFDGDKFDIPYLSKLDKRIAHIDRKIDKWRTKFRDSYYESLSCDMKTKYPEKKYIKSQNLLKLESKRRKLYQKHTNIRKDIRCKAVNSIVKQYPSAIVIEDINFNTSSWKIKGANKWNKRVSDVSPADFLENLKKKM